MTIPTQVQDLKLITPPPTQGDAQLVVQLAQLGQAMSIDRGSALLFKHHKAGGLTYEQFDAIYPVGSDDSNAILNVLKWYETIGTLVKRGLLDRDLILDWLWVAGAWDICKPIALGQRTETGVPQMWENFEALAASRI